MDDTIAESGIKRQRQLPPQKPPVEHRVGFAASVVLVIIALFFDLLSIIPFIGGVCSSLFIATFTLYLWTKGVSIFSGRKLITNAVSFVGEWIPFVSTLPLLTAGIIATLILLRIEERSGLSLVNPLSKGITPPRLSRKPLNQNGVRAPRKIIPLEEQGEDLREAA